MHAWRRGADRSIGRPPTPDRAASEQRATAHVRGSAAPRAWPVVSRDGVAWIVLGDFRVVRLICSVWYVKVFECEGVSVADIQFG